jgi:hypothetical protein
VHEWTYLEGRIRNVSTQQCISLADSTLTMGSCLDTASFVRIVGVGEVDPAYRLELGFKVLDEPFNSDHSGSAMGLWTWNGGPNQQFRIENSPQLGVETYRLRMLHSYLYLHPAGTDTLLVQDPVTAGSGFDWELIREVTTGIAAHPPAAAPRSLRLRIDALGRKFSGSRDKLPFKAMGTVPSP